MKTEELASAVKTRIVTDRYFHHAEAGFVEFSGHLHADHTTGRFEIDHVEYLSANETEIAIHIADRERKRKSHGAPICGADQDAVPGVGALDLVAIDEVDIRSQLGEQIMDFTDIVLAVPIRIKDQLFAGVLESGNESGAIPLIVRMVDGAYKGKFSSEPVSNGPCLVLAPVVDDEYFEVISNLLYLSRRRPHDLFDRVLVIVGGEESC